MPEQDPIGGATTNVDTGYSGYGGPINLKVEPFPSTGGGTGGLLGGFDKLPSDGVSERWRYRPIGRAVLADRDGNPCPAWIVSRPIPLTGDIARHEFVVVADQPGATPEARFSYGPANGKLVSLTGAGDNTDKADEAAWQSWNQPFSGVQLQQIPAADASVVAAGRRLDQLLGTPSHAGLVDYTHVPMSPKQANSNSAATWLADDAIHNDPSHLGIGGLRPYLDLLTPGWGQPYPR